MNNCQRGKCAEYLARIYLRLHGYHIIAHNIRCSRGSTIGEIDVVATHKKCLIFAEIKERQTLDSAAYAVSPTQKQRLIRGAQVFVSQHPQYAEYDIRFDAILIVFPWQIKHLKNAWTA